MQIERYKYVNTHENADFLFVDEVFHSYIYHDGSDYYEPIYSASNIKDGKWIDYSFMDMFNHWLYMYASADKVIEYILNDEFILNSDCWLKMKESNYSIEFFDKYTKETLVVK